MAILGVFNFRINLNGEEVLHGRTPENKINDALDQDLQAIIDARIFLDNKPKDKSNLGMLNLSPDEINRDMQMQKWINSEQALLFTKQRFIKNTEP